ncbi:glycerophosphoryl diester phosphodiesterase [Alsobacter metallidurans]|uniref:Glycerophosphoryl diester phosphodiesterase n=1 Tax=Alsobacter metallidurans TaxID=340221 RepID=A0A917I6F0_9HYPH|nr:glycerophosphodiester phosphodiesterase family protein [Alsobacter metallidurans]GGH16314.1 glycerophosphoryl diester phosphodiesterase [Alsobacter metallidurans]
MWIIGHRGARNLWAENSLGGFRRTIDLGVDAVELDLHLTRDREIVVIHDPLLDRTTTGRGPVAALGLDALRQLRLQDTVDERIPTLDETLALFAPTSLHLELEIKTDSRGVPYPGLVQKTVAMVERYHMVERVRLTCFVPEVLEEIRAVAPSMRRLASLDRRSAEMLGGLNQALKRFMDLDCTIAVEKSLLEAEQDACLSVVGTARLGVWAPNTATDLHHWLRQPIAQLTTDRPDLAVDIRAQLAGNGSAS